jgi:IS30 family transposase
MPPTKEISFGEKVNIKHWFEQGMSTKEIATKLGRHPA